MLIRAGDNIISPLGFTTEENFRAVGEGRSGLRRHEGALMDVPEAFMASLIDRERLRDAFADVCHHADNCTPLEQAAILSAGKAAEEAQIDLSHPRVLFVFSSTKGNVHLLDERERRYGREHLYLWHSAQLLATYFGNPNVPVVVSNACISGASAQIAAMRALHSGAYDYAVVTGVDLLSRFIISGFQSFKALSQEMCRPFDVSRAGLNLGEAAATVIYRQEEQGCAGDVALLRGAVRNDANHISGPSRTGEGCFRALRYVLQDIPADAIAFVNAHGTATLYNDAMESAALARAGLNTVPVNSLKGYFGHTLGAAGVLESIISHRALQARTVLPTLGFSEPDNDCPISVTRAPAAASQPYCLKMLSGFGGCNAVLLFKLL
ncbi:MAG: beta-ketoacyl synthase [Bacteroidales bacterium]|jgi:3-oxoacyl-[acyl-carrier-protein] synthase-1|nr:beta-ketoacyl synthase [Bacteroidales bacterium]